MSLSWEHIFLKSEFLSLTRKQLKLFIISMLCTNMPSSKKSTAWDCTLAFYVKKGYAAKKDVSL